MGCMTTKAPDEPQAHPARRRGARTKGDEREDQILSAMRSLLADHPIDDVTIDDISSAAGISRTSFYFYFPSKQAVLTTLMERIWDDFASTHDWFDAVGLADRSLVREAYAATLVKRAAQRPATLHGPAGTLPIGLAQLGLQDLAGCADRHLVDEDNAVRDPPLGDLALEICETLNLRVMI